MFFSSSHEFITKWYVFVVSWYGQSWTGSMRSRKKNQLWNRNHKNPYFLFGTQQERETTSKTIYRFRFFTKHDHMYVSSCLHCFLYFLFRLVFRFCSFLYRSVSYRSWLFVVFFSIQFLLNLFCCFFFSYCKSGLLFWSRHFIFMHSYLIWCYIYLALWPLNVPEIE